MAYISKEVVNKMKEKLKVVNKKYNMKATLSGSNSLAVTCTITSGKLFKDYHGKSATVNHYYLDRDFTGEELQYLQEVNDILHSEGYYDKSDAMIDYFCTSWYTHIHVGKWNKSYVNCI